MPFDSGDYEANKEKKRAQQKAYREANKERIRAREKAYYEANKEKELARQKAYREANKEKLAAYDKARYEANKEKVLARYKAYRKANTEKQMFLAARHRAKRNNIPFNLTEDYLKSIYPSDMICPVLGFEMSVGKDENGWADTSPSLDRIIPEKGYVQGNVIIVSMRANLIKTNATPEEIRKVADFYEKVYEQLDNRQLDLDFTDKSTESTNADRSIEPI